MDANVKCFRLVPIRRAKKPFSDIKLLVLMLEFSRMKRSRINDVSSETDEEETLTLICR